MGIIQKAKQAAAAFISNGPLLLALAMVMVSGNLRLGMAEFGSVASANHQLGIKEAASELVKDGAGKDLLREGLTKHGQGVGKMRPSLVSFGSSCR